MICWHTCTLYERREPDRQQRRERDQAAGGTRRRYAAGNRGDLDVHDLYDHSERLCGVARDIWTRRGKVQRTRCLHTVGGGRLQQPEDAHRQQCADSEYAVLCPCESKCPAQRRKGVQNGHKDHEHRDRRDSRQHTAGACLQPPDLSLFVAVDLVLVAHRVCRYANRSSRSCWSILSAWAGIMFLPCSTVAETRSSVA